MDKQGYIMIDLRTNEFGNKIYKSKFKSMAMTKNEGNLGIKMTNTNFSIQKYIYPPGFLTVFISLNPRVHVQEGST